MDPKASYLAKGEAISRPRTYWVSGWGAGGLALACTTTPTLPHGNGMVLDWVLSDTGKCAARLAFGDASHAGPHYSDTPSGRACLIAFLLAPYGDRPALCATEADALALMAKAPVLEPDLSGAAAVLGLVASVGRAYRAMGGLKS